MKYIYSAVVTPGEDGAKYYARVPDLPGCITTGDSLQDAIEQITDAASGWLVVAEDEGLPIPAAAPQDTLEHTSRKSAESTAPRSCRKGLPPASPRPDLPPPLPGRHFYRRRAPAERPDVPYCGKMPKSRLVVVRNGISPARTFRRGPPPRSLIML